MASDFLPASSQRLTEMTANYFFSCCALGYHANQYPGGDKLPRDQYRQHADGRDDGLLDITPDSPQAFSLWYHNREKSVDIPGRSAVVETPRTFHSMYRKMRPVIRFSWLVPPGPEQLRLFVSFLHYIGLAARLQSERLKCSSLD